MKSVQTVVLDEVDVLFLDDSFDLSTLGATTPASAQFLFVTATLPCPSPTGEYKRLENTRDRLKN